MDKKFVVRFAGYWTVNTVILALANTYFPGAFALGNAYLTVPMAAVFSGFLVTALLFLARGLAHSQNFVIKGRVFMFLYYWLAAAASIWLTARIASVSGFGIVRFTWAIGCGLAISASNWVLRQALKGAKLSSK